MEGWIKLHRSFLEHWLCDEYRPLTKREAWETILFTVNYENKKVLINGALIECNRGQALLSLESWAKKFVWSVGQVRHFFKLLENDDMIITEGLKNTTRLTVCNYDKYQDKQQPDNNLTTTSQQPDNNLITTTKESKEIKNNIIIPWKKDFQIYLNDLREAYKKIVTHEYIIERESFHGNLDIKKTLEKSCKDYWATEEGWKNKKAKKSNEINWKSTFNKALTQDFNKVWKPKNTINEIQQQQPTKKPDYYINHKNEKVFL